MRFLDGGPLGETLRRRTIGKPYVVKPVVKPHFEEMLATSLKYRLPSVRDGFDAS
mgnify:CR=1 FL=1